MINITLAILVLAVLGLIGYRQIKASKPVPVPVKRNDAPKKKTVVRKKAAARKAK